MKLYSIAPSCHYTYYGKNSAPLYEDLHGFVIVSQPEAWYLAFVNDRDEEQKKIEAILMERSSVAQQFIFSLNQAPVMKCLDDVISVVNVVPIDHNTYNLTRPTIAHANRQQEIRYCLILTKLNNTCVLGS